MREESPESFPLPNDPELIYAYIQPELRKAGINLQKFSKDGNVITVSTDMEVPEKIKSNICHCAACKGITIKFLTSG